MIDDLWYKNAVVYSLDIKTFMDADGNGIGDLTGLMQRLDYLHSIGVDVVWLAPV
jgi:maltose alpha-D-glucosyltransferase/alpha-amylase